MPFDGLLGRGKESTNGKYDIVHILAVLVDLPTTLTNLYVGNPDMVKSVQSTP